MSENTSQEIVKSKAEIERSLKQIEEYYNLFTSGMSTSQNNLLRRFQDVQKEFSNILTSSIHEFENLITPLGQKKDQALNQDIDGFKTNLIETLNNTRGIIQESSKTFQNRVEGLIRESIGVLRSNANKIANHVDSIYETENQAVYTLKDNLSNSVDQLKDIYANKVEQEIESVKSATKDAMDDILKRLEQFRSETNNITQSGQGDVERTVNTVMADISSGFEGSAATLQDLLESLLNKMSRLFDEKTEAFRVLADNFTNNLHENIESNNIDIEESSKTVISSLEGFKTQEKEHLTSILTDIKSSFIESANLVDFKAHEQYKTTMNFFRSKLYQDIENVKGNFHEFYDGSIALLETLISQLNKGKDVLENNREKMINGSINSMGAIGDEMEKSLNQMVDFLQSTYTTEKKRIQEELDSSIEVYSEDHLKRLNALEGILLQSIQNESVNKKTILDSHKDAIKTFTSDQTNELTQIFQKVQDETNIENNKFVKDQRKWLDSTSIDINNRIRDDLTNLIQVLEGVAPQIATIADSFQGTREESFERAINTLESATQLFKTEVSDWASSIYSLVEQEMSTVSKRLDGRQTESKQVMDDVLSEIQSSQEKTASEFQEKSNNQFSEIENRISEVEPSIIQNVDQLGTQFSQTIETFIEKGQRDKNNLIQKNNEFTAQTTKFKAETEENFETISRNVSVQLENIVKPAKKVITASEDVINKLKS
ncbi:MAG: hypothetical protein ACXAC7_07110 [Candidatus Hodarchaeales archaeon]|jgi:uncharacterized protein YukE